ncbi:glycosyl transferase [Dipodascopsis uninucleata]
MGLGNHIGLYPALRYAVVASILFKVLLYPAYKSTDFEVHRNWLAITYSKPISEWYYEATSEWTLDYPPFFAYFEWALSQVAVLVDPKMVDIKNLRYASNETIYFQRTSVIVSELALVYALQRYISNFEENHRQAAYAVAMSIYFSPGLLIIDNIHFQYNGMLFSILIWSLVFMKEKKTLLSATLFTALLCFKHIYLYLAPAYFVYLLRIYCLDLDALAKLDFLRVIKWKNSINLGLCVIGVILTAFGPFIYMGQLPQVLSRLFPFSRGLCHAYWAPNVWALYSGIDRILYAIARKLGYNVYAEDIISTTRGFVGGTSFSVLPEVQPKTTFYLTLFYQSLSLIPLLIKPSFERFVSSLTLCGFASFLFGWHVHEKAILLVIIPFTFLVTSDRRYLTPFHMVSVSGYVSLFPLIFTSAESAIKYLYTIAWIFAFFTVFDDVTKVRTTRRVFLLDRISRIYLLGYIPLLFFVSVYKKFSTFQNLEFLSLMLISIYCALGVVGSWAGFTWLHLFT